MMLQHNPLTHLSPIHITHARIEYGTGVGTFTDREYLMVFTYRGISKWRLEGREYEFKTGDCMVLPPHIPHTVVPEPGLVQYIIHFTPGPKLQIPDTWPFMVHIPQPEWDHLKGLFDLLLLERERKNPQALWVNTGLMISLLGIYSRHIGTEVPSQRLTTKTWRNISRAVELVQQKPEEQHSVESLSRHCGLSVSYFCRAFQQNTGYSPHEYVNRVRIQKAKLLLLEPRLNCTEVAGMVGFSSIHVFSKVFKRLERRSPTKYAQNPWMGPGGR